MSTHIAIDIGGSHGRGTLGVYEGGNLSISPLGSFSTEPVLQDSVLCWNLESMIRGIKHVMLEASQYAPSVDSVAIDTMGVAFVLLDRDNELICPPVYTRVAQEASLKKEILSDLGAEELYRITGLEQTKLNSLYYLTYLKRTHPEYIKKTARLLMLPDYLNYLLTGIMRSEYTISTTSNLFDIKHRRWSKKLLSYAGIPQSAPPEPVQCCNRLGLLKPEFVLSPPLGRTMVVNAPAHDTASAFFSLPSLKDDQILISSGTWGMIGCILDQPVLTPNALEAGFANEGAALGKIKFLNNAPNMSILEECRKIWKLEGHVWDWESLCQSAEESSIRSCIDLQSPLFLNQSAMPQCIRSYCRSSGQAVPSDPGDVTRVVLESIVQNYHGAFNRLTEIVHRNFRSAVIMGGAARNRLLIRLLQESLQLPVMAGNCEAAVTGNLFSQLMAMGQLHHVTDLSAINVFQKDMN